MPVTAKCGNVIVDNWLRATGALGGKELEKVFTTVGVACLLVIAIITKVLAAVGTEKVLWMPGFVEGGDASLWKEKKQLADL